ncbi:MAG: hypothetical protein ACK4N5_13355 [Myxococcales bacterium]
MRHHLLRPMLALLVATCASFALGAADAAPKKSKPAAAKTAAKKKKKVAPAKAKKKAPLPDDEEDEAVSMPALDLDGPAPAPKAAQKPGLKLIDVTADAKPDTAADTTVAAAVERERDDDENMLELAAGLHLFRRDFTLGDPLQRVTPSYALDMAPSPFVSAALFPGGTLVKGLPKQLGIAASFEHTVGVSSVSTGQNGTVVFPTRAHALQLDLLCRFVLPRWELTARGGYGWRSFAISDAGAVSKPRIPSVSYDHLSLGGQARFRLSDRVFLSANAGARKIVGAGELESAAYFPGASGFGVTAGAGVGFVVGPVETRLGFDLERYMLALDPLNSAASEATDQYLGFSLAAAFRS